MSTTTLDTDSIGFVCTLVRERSAIELDASKTYLIDARLSPLAKKLGFESADEFIQTVRTKRQVTLESNLVEALTTNETSFFRDMHPFEALRSHVIPEMIKSRSADRKLNVWSAACSTGQELYSIAMILRDEFPELKNWNVELLGTDISDQVLEKARSGQYLQIEVNRGLSASLLVKHFEKAGLNWRLRDEIRNLAKFQKLNFIERWPQIPSMDVIFLRNVLIYFSPENKRQILQKVRQVMAPDAVLFLGAAETTMNLDSNFERVQEGKSVYYRLR